jgi:hypothetical protein
MNTHSNRIECVLKKVEKFCSNPEISQERKDDLQDFIAQNIIDEDSDPNIWWFDLIKTYPELCDD